MLTRLPNTTLFCRDLVVQNHGSTRKEPYAPYHLSAGPRILFELATIHSQPGRHLCESPSFSPYAGSARKAVKRDRLTGPPSSIKLEERLTDFVGKLQSYRQVWQETEINKCADDSSSFDFGDRAPMSQRPPVSQSAPRSPQRITLPPVQLRDEGQHRVQDVEGLSREGERRAPLPSPQLSQIEGRTTPGEGWRSVPLRAHGLQSMLNPTEPDVKAPIERRTSTSMTQSPSFVPSRPSSNFGVSPTSTTPTTTFTSHHTAAELGLVSEPTGGSLSKTRKILTPRSPLRTFSATRSIGGQFIDATRSPFLSGKSRSYSEMHMESSSMTTPPLSTSSQQQAHYGFPPTVTSSLAGRRTSGDTMQAPLTIPPSQSASPSISLSGPHQPSGQTSSAGNVYVRGPLPPTTSAAYYPGSSFANIMPSGVGHQFHGEPAAPEGPYSSQASSQAPNPVASASRPSLSSSDAVSVLTISTAQGAIQVPIDMHQASKLADEKRKRNAGASARFRQRRKDKEKEATTNIDKLNEQARDLERRVREVEQERDFYRSQRDRLRDIVYQTPEIRHHAQGPPSPRFAHAPFRGQDSSSVASSSSVLGFSPEPTTRVSDEERAPRRRRFDGRFDSQGNVIPQPYSQHPLSTLPALQPPQSLPRPQGLPSLPPLRMAESLPAPASGPHSTSAPPTESAVAPPPYPPFSQVSYERGWPPGERRV